MVWLYLFTEPTQIYRFLRTRNLIAVSVFFKTTHMINSWITAPLSYFELTPNVFVSLLLFSAYILAQDTHVHVSQKLQE